MYLVHHMSARNLGEELVEVEKWGGGGWWGTLRMIGS